MNSITVLELVTCIGRASVQGRKEFAYSLWQLGIQIPVTERKVPKVKEGRMKDRAVGTGISQAIDTQFNCKRISRRACYGVMNESPTRLLGA